MCGRFVSITDPDGLARFFVVDDRKADELPPNYNVAPTDPVYAVAEHRGERTLVTFRWGLVPSWAKDAKIASRLINARAETLTEKPAFRAAFERRRCLVPADGFYEWERRGDARVPHYIHSRAGTPLAFAGLWEVWRDPQDPRAEPLRTCTIVTTDASPGLRGLHDRMPAILAPDQWGPWLDREVTDTSLLRDLLRPPPDDLVRFHEVSQEANSPRNNHPGLLKPVTADGDIS